MIKLRAFVQNNIKQVIIILRFLSNIIKRNLYLRQKCYLKSYLFLLKLKFFFSSFNEILHFIVYNILYIQSKE